MAEIDLNEADQKIKEVLQEGRNTPSNLASELGYTREYISQRLKRLREHDLVERVGRGLYEWSEDDISESDSSEEAGKPVGKPETEKTDTEVKEEIYEELDATEPPTDEINTPDISSRVQEVVEDVAEGWDDDERLQNRKQAAAEVLHHAVETGEAVGKSSEIVEEVREKYPVVGQNEETYWRKNIRDVLSEVGDYSRGSHKYTVETLETDGEDA